MSLDPHSPEFARLVSAWLDETVTAEEAARLWQAVAESPECAWEFAAAVRFDALLADTVQGTARETSALAQAAGLPFQMEQAAAPAARKRVISSRVLAIAAVLAVLGLTSWLVWHKPEGPDSGPIAHRPAKAPDTPEVRRPAVPAASVDQPVALPSVPEVAAAPVDETPLIERLDRFFLPSISFDHVPLNEALGILQGHLQNLNFLNAEVLRDLRIEVPSDAAGRRVSFQSGPIAFLKAVRAVAGLAGCDVTIDGLTIELTLQRGIFPQVAERRNLKALLAGRLTADGTEAAADAESVAALMVDAAAMGVALKASASVDGEIWVGATRGQMTALETLTQAREQLGELPMPAFQLYVTAGDSIETNEVIDEQTVVELQQDFEQDGIAPVAIVAGPDTAAAPEEDPAADVPMVSVQPVGEVAPVGTSLPRPFTPAVIVTAAAVQHGREVTGLLLRGQGMSFTTKVAATAAGGSAAATFVTITLLPVSSTSQP